MDLATQRLCLFCRKLEDRDKACEWVQSKMKSPDRPTAHGNQQILTEPWSSQDDALLRSLRQHPSALCQRCSSFDIIQLFEHKKPLDLQQRGILQSEREEYYKSLRSAEMRFDLLSTFLLTPSCQLCRLIYRILPRPPPDHDNCVLALNPYRWYVRQDSWETIPIENRESFSMLFGISSGDLPFNRGTSFWMEGMSMEAVRPGEAIAMAPRHASSTKIRCKPRLIGEKIDFTAIRNALDHCTVSHPQRCRPGFHKGLLDTKMVDVITRTVVECPDQCDYVALSYVWGGVHPTPGALQAGTLPQTIEDALTVANKLGRRYVWIDALCIDQTQNPTPQQAALKKQQLELMHLIYSCAAVTLCVVSGPNADWGIPGVSRERLPSTQEDVDGVSIFCIPPQLEKEVKGSIWRTRAWTYQEQYSASRTLFFTETQYLLQCSETVGPGHLSEACEQDLDMVMSNIPGAESRFYEMGLREQFLKIYESILQDYTSRAMTNESDSLNALKGMLNVIASSQSPPAKFFFGLPLNDYPQLLGWFHDMSAQPKRRLEFPSWSWAGWEGTVRYPLGMKFDLLPHVENIIDKELTVRGWVLTLEIRTEPFSEVVLPGTNTTVGCVRERNFSHNNTLPSGRYQCLVVARAKTEMHTNGLVQQQVFLLVVRGNANSLMERQTVITISSLAQDGRDFMEFSPQLSKIRLGLA